MDDSISRQVAIDALAKDMPQAYTPDGSHPADDGIFMVQEIYADCIQTLKELPSAQPEPCEDASCPYCHEDSDGYVTPLEKNCHAFIRFGMNGWCLNLQANKWHGEVKINYCPMCGRKF